LQEKAKKIKFCASLKFHGLCVFLVSENLFSHNVKLLF
jgi:hypothetical protein